MLKYLLEHFSLNLFRKKYQHFAEISDAIKIPRCMTLWSQVSWLNFGWFYREAILNPLACFESIPDKSVKHNLDVDLFSSFCSDAWKSKRPSESRLPDGVVVGQVHELVNQLRVDVTCQRTENKLKRFWVVAYFLGIYKTSQRWNFKGWTNLLRIIFSSFNNLNYTVWFGNYVRKKNVFNNV